MSRTTDYLQLIEEMYTDTFYPDHPDSYQQVLDDLDAGRRTHASMADVLRSVGKLPTNGKQGGVQ